LSDLVHGPEDGESGGGMTRHGWPAAAEGRLDSGTRTSNTTQNTSLRCKEAQHHRQSLWDIMFLKINSCHQEMEALTPQRNTSCPDSMILSTDHSKHFWLCVYSNSQSENAGKNRTQRSCLRSRHFPTTSTSPYCPYHHTIYANLQLNFTTNRGL
jgi:hypothetical protein